MLYYVLTFLFCFIIESVPRYRSSKILRNLLVLWLYGFWCFGYMVGSDWRSYELDFVYGFKSLDSFKTTLYPVFYKFADIFKLVSNDFFVFKAFINIVYLHSIFYVVKNVFGRINFLAIVFLMHVLMYMLIGGPLKFVCASVFIMYGTGAMLAGNWKKWILLTIISIFFHFSVGFSLLLVALIWTLWPGIVRIRKWILLSAYFGLTLLTSNMEIFDLIFGAIPSMGLGEVMTSKILGYSVDNLDSLFSLGSLKDSIFFVIVLYHRDKLMNFSKHGSFMYALSISYSIVFRLLFIIPVGFRISMYLSIFFYLSLLIVFYESYAYSSALTSFKRWTIMSLITVPAALNLWQGYEYLPYSNSLRYVTLYDHLPFKYRTSHNYKESYKRTGIDHSK